jgi:hypothetical protein
VRCVRLYRNIYRDFKSNPKSNPKHSKSSERQLTHSTCYAHAIKKDNRVLDG